MSEDSEPPAQGTCGQPAGGKSQEEIAELVAEIEKKLMT
jgi:hypothetical protein